MKVLVLGTGAREHAIVRMLSKDTTVTDIHAAPGNPGMAQLATVHPVNLADNAAIVALAQELNSDLVVVGPEAPLVAGAADALNAAGIDCFGPSAAAAQLEGSKSFAKEVMATAGVPTATAHTCTTLAQAEAALAEFGPTYVVKDDGLDAGKGVVVTDDLATALAHVTKCLAKPDGAVVIEEYLDGPEFSVFCFCDGTNVVALPPAQDYKRINDGDEGLNTGGMGAYSPLDWAPEDLVADTLKNVAVPVITEMKTRGTPFVGILYVGLALTKAGIKVIEFNARLGDPDGNIALSRMITGLGVVAKACVSGTLADLGPLKIDDRACVTVVLASEGYPVKPLTGRTITGDFSDHEDSFILHAGTKAGPDGSLTSAGGRVLGTVAFGADVAAARDLAYRRMRDIALENGHYRQDIAAQMP